MAEVDEEEPASEIQPAEDGGAENDGATADEDAAREAADIPGDDIGDGSSSEKEVGGYEGDNSVSTGDVNPGGSDSDINGDNHGDSNWLTYEATAYIALCDSGCSGITATGIDVRDSIYRGGDRIIAVDPSSIALGSRVEVRLADGTTFTAQAQDTGGAIKGAKIDVLVATEAEAWDFGRQSVELRILND
ncbi:3D domain-containing protein [Psychrobacillus sp. MER TA 17]|nr:3D domain-containing protein [Psychrobacillus sp. MER TA 17]